MTPLEIMIKVVRELAEQDIWRGTLMEDYRWLGNTNRGEAGERFVYRYLKQHGIHIENGTRTDETDWKIEGMRVEVKTASLGSGNTFQFNHVRRDRNYACIIAIGVCPNEIVCDVWPKAEVMAEKYGKLVPMARSQEVTYKITRKLDSMLPAGQLPGLIRQLLREQL